MVVVALAFREDHDVPAIMCDPLALLAALQLAYQAGQQDAARDNETYAFLRRTIRNMQRSMRKARPSPHAGVEAGLDLMLRAVEERLGIRAAA